MAVGGDLAEEQCDAAHRRRGNALGSPNLDDYVISSPTGSDTPGTPRKVAPALVVGEKLQHVGIRSWGTIDGNGARFRDKTKFRPKVLMFALEIVDGGRMDGVNISNIQIDGVTVPIFIRLGNRGRPFENRNVTPGIGTLRNAALANITASRVSSTGCSITGLPGHPVENVSLKDL